MNRFWGQTLSVAMLAAAAGSAVPACAHNDASLYVDGVLAPPTPTGGECVYTPDPTSPHISIGEVDGALADHYSAEFLLGNTLIAQGNSATPNAETSRIEIQGAIIQVIDPATNATVESNTVLTTALLEPASGTTPSYAATSATIMNKAAVQHFTPAGNGSNIAQVNVTFYGVTLGGQSIQSNVYQFPVEVCSKCLIYVPAGAPTGATLNYCAGKSPLADSVSACHPGMDQPEDCQFCYAGPGSTCDLTP
jgi:hypothetical protein